LVDPLVPRGGHQPRARVGGDPGLGPALERAEERLLGEILRPIDVPHEAHEAADQAGGLDAPDGLDRFARELLRRTHRSLLAVFAHACLRRSPSARSRSSCSRSSGVSASPKSSGSKIRRISSSLSSPGMGGGQRRAHSTASSIDRTCQIQYPATSSFVSAKGPSTTRVCPPTNWIRFPF